MPTPGARPRTADEQVRPPTPAADRLPTGAADPEATLVLRIPPGLAGHLPAQSRPPAAEPPGPGDIASWQPAVTPFGTFQLVPVRLPRDLPLLAAWMNDPVVNAFWSLAGPAERTAAHLRAQLEGDGASVPCLGLLDGVPMSYWEVYRADLDPLAAHYPAQPHDTGLHLLIGPDGDRGRGVGSALLRATAESVLRHRPACCRVLAEPDVRNSPSVAAFLKAGFRFAAELSLPDKQAALMVRDRG
ncbi:GNAT family N-acetyltransferase [Streptomyces sp. NPDC059740]|uniref:GNAT family N-acetyltransferase n=1 Tax=Streptomyces sp. NPDC059740 TaxID=3346926 RepID=UPI00365A9140